MGVILLTAFVWIVGAIGCVVMKRIQPEDKLYPIYVVLICISLTVFVIGHIS